ncbi:MAG: hypothetical protein IJX84_08595 [Clostridia bacterium]|nr:hypothetical protein [Clostridia bacterium]
MSINELEAKASTYRDLLAEIKQLQEMADAVKAELIGEMDARKADALTAGSYTLRYIAYESSRVNTKALKAAGLYDQYSSKQTALRFTVQ